MTSNGWLQIGVFFALVLLGAKPMGLYMARVYEGKKTWLDPVLGPVERLLYRLTGVDDSKEMRWTEYGVAMLILLAGHAAADLRGGAAAALDSAVESAASGRGGTVAGMEHGEFVYHEYQTGRRTCPSRR